MNLESIWRPASVGTLMIGAHVRVENQHQPLHLDITNHLFGTGNIPNKQVKGHPTVDMSLNNPDGAVMMVKFGRIDPITIKEWSRLGVWIFVICVQWFFPGVLSPWPLFADAGIYSMKHKHDSTTELEAQ